ncbi:regulator [Streptomyces sp. WM6372]|nr:regulator [Streptomyces sp. WM6372]
MISARWRRSSRSTGMNNCVETAVLGGGGLLAVRDSKRTDGPAVLFTEQAWTGFLAAVRADVDVLA